MTDKHTLVERLNAIPVWMVGAMTPGWQEHGSTAYEAATRITALEAREAELVEALAQYRDDLRYPPTPDSKIRRLEMIAKLLERMTP